MTGFMAALHFLASFFEYRTRLIKSEEDENGFI